MYIDELAMFRFALTAQEIADMQTMSYDPTAVGSMMYRFDNVSDGLIMRDYSGMGNHGTLTQGQHRSAFRSDSSLVFSIDIC